MKFFTTTCRLALVLVLALSFGKATGQTGNNKLLGVNLKEATVLSTQVAQALNLTVVMPLSNPKQGDYIQSFKDAEKEEANLYIRYAVFQLGPVNNILIWGDKKMLLQLYKALFDKKFAPDNPNEVTASVTRGKEVISLVCGLEDGNIKIEPKEK